jgi:hypothetical protein
VVISPFSAKGVIKHDDGLGPYEHTSILKMVEWRWGLQPLTDRDKNARNLAEMLDFSLSRTDVPAIPQPPAPPAPMVCGVNGVSATRPRPIALAGGGSLGSSSGGGGGAGGTTLPTTATPAGESLVTAGFDVAAVAGAALLGAAAALKVPADTAVPEDS